MFHDHQFNLIRCPHFNQLISTPMSNWNTHDEKSKNCQKPNHQLLRLKSTKNGLSQSRFLPQLIIDLNINTNLFSYV